MSDEVVGVAKPNLDADSLRRRLIAAGGLWQQLRVVADTGSTNADLAQAAREGAASGTILIAEHQGSGRGRFERTWTAPPGTSVAISVLLRPDAGTPAVRWLWLPLLAGLAVADGIWASTGIETNLKWPNDVLIGDRKVCGILSERVGDAAVIGMGINTTATATQLPVPTATSLAVAGSNTPVEDVVTAVLQAFATWYRRWASGISLRGDYQARCGTLGRQVRVELSETESVRGLAVGVDDTGCLVVEVGGVKKAFAAGDVFHLR